MSSPTRVDPASGGTVTAMATRVSTGNTSNKTIRLEDELWSELQAAADEMGLTAAAWIREAVRWGLRKPGARVPQRVLEPRKRGREQAESPVVLAQRLVELLAEQEA